MKSLSYRRSGAGATSIAALGLFLALASSTFAADAPSAPPAAASRASTVPVVAATPASTPSPPTTGASSAPAPAKVICFQTSIRCFSATPRTPAASGAARAATLDLRAPELTRVFSEAELSKPLQDPYEQEEIQETVQVQGERQRTPVSVGLMAIPWAIIHPTQAWRILMPVPEAK